jgi:hypothetical protein
MTLKNTALLLLSFSTLGLAACQMPYKLEEAQYWQRKNSTSALYLRGPKAQQTLHMDIATCTNEINELERLGPIREAIPADTQNGVVPDPTSAEGRLKRWDTPKRDGYLYAEHFDYTDFESCMDFKGWERVERLPYERAELARKEYLNTLYGYKYQTDYPKPQANQGSANPYESSPDQRVNN